MSGRYVEVRYPWRAVIDTRSRAPGRFYATLIDQAMRYRLPARQRFGRSIALVGRLGTPKGLVPALSLLRSGPRPDLDRLLSELRVTWPEIAARSERLPPDPVPLTALALQRSAALTVFAFGPEPAPLCVLKLPAAGDDRVDREVQALLEAEPARASPRSLGAISDARIQEGIDGVALRLEPLTPDRARRLRWTRRLAALGQALTRVAATTAKHGRSSDLGEPLEWALDYPRLGGKAARTLRAATSDLAGLRASVRRHGDASAQNCLFVGQRLTGLVDWEASQTNGAPGFDVMNSALAYLDHGVGLVRWSDELLVETFKTAWRESGFFQEARAAAEEAARAGGVPDRYLEPLLIGFFANRLGRRAAAPEAFAISPQVAAATLEVVCAD